MCISNLKAIYFLNVLAD